MCTFYNLELTPSQEAILREGTEMEAEAEKTYTIKQIAEQTGVSEDTMACAAESQAGASARAKREAMPVSAVERSFFLIFTR